MPQVKCKICGNEFYIKPSHQKYGWGKFCSSNCRVVAQFNGERVKCNECGKFVYRSQSQLKRSGSGKYFCSKSCQTLWRNKIFSGENHVNWKTGESAYRQILIRNGRKVECILCHIRDKRVLTVHHKDRNRKNNVIENLIWLCLNCHYLVHHDRKLEREPMEALV